MDKKYTTGKLILLLIFTLLITVILWRPNWQIGGDGFGYYAYARSIFFDGDFDLNNEFAFFDQLYGHYTSINWQTSQHNIANPFAVGASILWVPFIVLAQLVDSLFNFTDNFSLSGYNLPYQLAIGFGTWFYFIVGIILIFKTLIKFFSPQQAWWATISAIALSPVGFYLIYEPSMSHALTVFSSSLVFFVSIKIYQSKNIYWRQTVYLGLSIALLFLLRWQDILLAILPVGIVLSGLIGKKHLDYKKISTIIIFFVIGILPQLCMWQHLFGSWITVPQGETFFSLSSPHIWQFLFSSYHGMLAVHPLLVLSLVGLGWSIKKFRLIAILLLLALVLQVYMNSALYDWYGGGSFGARRMISSLFIFAWGLAYLFLKISRRRIAICLVALLIFTGSIFNALLMMSYARQIMPLNQFTTYQQLYSAPLKLISDL